MKTRCKHLLLLACWALPAALASPADAAVPMEIPVTNETAPARQETVIRGVVRDRQSRRRLPHVNVVLEGTPIGTVSNADGAFELRFSQADGRRIRFSHIGYASSFLQPVDAADEVTIWLMPVETLLSDVVVYGADPYQIVVEALERIDRNYPSEDQLLTLFYRETVQKGRRYIGISEAVMEAYKGAYTRRNAANDRVRMHKGRQLISQRSRDTLSVKIAGGPNQAQIMDIVKNPDALLDPAYLHDYRFELAGSTEIDGRMQYVIFFRPQRKTDYPLFSGHLYIDRERLAFTRAEFEMDLTDRELAIRSVLQKKPAGLRFHPQKIAFVVGYRADGDRSALNYIQSTIRARCDWRKRLFTSVYTTQTEMVAVDRKAAENETVGRREAFRANQIFSDLVEAYDDEDYWAGYNIIPPTESLEHAVERLRKEQRSEP